MQACDLLQRFSEYGDREAIIWKNQSYSYKWLCDRTTQWSHRIEDAQLQPGSVVVLKADYSPNSVAAFFALAKRGCIIVPLTEAVSAKHTEFSNIAMAESQITINGDDETQITALGPRADHSTYRTLRTSERPGLVLFSSGSTGQCKAAVHDLVNLLAKFDRRGKAMRTITFLLYDHIGGVNTMLYTLANGGCMVTVSRRSPNSVLSAIEQHQIELLPTSPTFINMVLLSEAYRRFDLNSLRLVTYGTEPMPESTLHRFHTLFPKIDLLQTYGLSEVGILRSRSKSPDSLWVRVGGDGFETRVVDNILHIKSASAMLGYLNAPSPFTDDGWFVTGDVVQIDGDYMRILGRESEIINVGGEKVYPAAVESVIREMKNVADATVRGERNPITGAIVTVDVQLVEGEPTAEFRKRLKRHCQQRLPAYQVPVKINVVDAELQTARFKKIRTSAQQGQQV